jgi:hypothetical protein
MNSLSLENTSSRDIEEREFFLSKVALKYENRGGRRELGIK